MGVRLHPQHLRGEQRSKCSLGTSRDLEAEGEQGAMEGEREGGMGRDGEAWRSPGEQESLEGRGALSQLGEGAGERVRHPKLQ